MLPHANLRVRKDREAQTERVGREKEREGGCEEMGKTLTRERERERIELGRERKRKMLLRRMNKKSILFLQVSYSTIINLGWYCNSIVNFFTITILGNASF